MKTRTNPDTGRPEVQVSADHWVDLEESAIEAGNSGKSLRTYLVELYGETKELDRSRLSD